MNPGFLTCGGERGGATSVTKQRDTAAAAAVHRGRSLVGCWCACSYLFEWSSHFILHHQDISGATVFCWTHFRFWFASISHNMRLCPACTHPTFFVRLLVPDTRALAVQRCPRQCNWKGARTCSSTDILRTSSVVAYFCLLHAFDQLHTHSVCSYATFTPEMIRINFHSVRPRVQFHAIFQISLSLYNFAAFKTKSWCQILREKRAGQTSRWNCRSRCCF